MPSSNDASSASYMPPPGTPTMRTLISGVPAPSTASHQARARASPGTVIFQRPLNSAGSAAGSVCGAQEARRREIARMCLLTGCRLPCSVCETNGTATAPSRPGEMLPTFIVIGAMKCGTTSLHHYLASHPDVFMSRKKELDYSSRRRTAPGAAVVRVVVPGTRGPVGGVFTSYTKFPAFQDVPRRMHALLPDIKLIYSVRDPVRRIGSHLYHRGLDVSTYEGFVARFGKPERSHYVETSRYFSRWSVS